MYLLQAESLIQQAEKTGSPYIVSLVIVIIVLAGAIVTLYLRNESKNEKKDSLILSLTKELAETTANATNSVKTLAASNNELKDKVLHQLEEIQKSINNFRIEFNKKGG